MTLDFVTCDNAAPSHVKVTLNGDTLAIVPINNGDVAEAEGFAEAIIEGLAGIWRVCRPTVGTGAQSSGEG